jgi:fluoride exporter
VTGAVLLLLAVAGGLGAATRFVVDGVVRARFPLLPTLVVNVSGSLLLGLLAGLALGGTEGGPVVAVLGTGFLGGYTTFSAASAETVRLLADGRLAPAALSSAGMLLASVAACAAGVALGRAL